jgi:sugar-specific transcriptional regulator TrmB
LGLSQNEARIYETLLESGELSVPGISLKTGIHRRNAYDTIERLVKKGLLFPVLASRDNKYNAVDPAKLLEVIKEKERKIQKYLPELESKYRARFAPEEAYIYRGLEGQKNVWRDVLRVAQTSYFIGAKASWFDHRLKEASKEFFAQANKRKIKFIELFDYEARTVLGFPKHFPGKLEYRVLPKEYSTSSVLHVFGDYVVTYTGAKILSLEDNAVFFVLKSAPLEESYRIWFRALWSVATG